MTENFLKTNCKNIFLSDDPEEMTRKFTDLWTLVINNQENNMDIVTVKNNVLQADSQAI